jgi:flagellar operon protein
MSPIRGLGFGSAAGAPGASSPRSAQGPRFAEVLKSKMEGLRWSAHAVERMSQRGIALSDADRASVEAALTKAAEKGSRNSLFLLRETGLVVSVENRTVVTAVDRADLQERVFTGIDSTVILE